MPDGLLRWVLVRKVWHAARLPAGRDFRTLSVYDKVRALCGGTLRQGWLWDQAQGPQCAACAKALSRPPGP